MPGDHEEVAIASRSSGSSSFSTPRSQQRLELGSRVGALGECNDQESAMTKSTKASPKADTVVDYDGLLRANAKRVFSEPSVERRLTALEELWVEDGVLVE